MKPLPGLACWLMPLRVTRVLIDTGIYPSPAADADVGEKLIAVGEVINFMWEIRSVGVLLTLIGCALLGWTVALGNRARLSRDIERRARRLAATHTGAPKR